MIVIFKVYRQKLHEYAETPVNVGVKKKYKIRKMYNFVKPGFDEVICYPITNKS